MKDLKHRENGNVSQDFDYDIKDCLARFYDDFKNSTKDLSQKFSQITKSPIYIKFVNK